MNSLRIKRSKLLKEEGSFTIEASLELPLVFVVVVLLLFLCLYIYQQSMLVQVSNAASERVAFIWNNSHREASNGAVSEGLHDSLYWRLTDDALLTSLFGWSKGESGGHISLPSSDGQGGGLPSRKLAKGNSVLPDGVRGEMNYDNKLLLRTVETKLVQSTSMTPVTRLMNRDGYVYAAAQSAVVDPVEFIRTIDLMRYYGSKFRGAGGSITDQGAASGVLQRFGGLK